MRMKALYGCVMILFFTVIPAFAQGKQPPGTDEIVSKMQSKLNLTQDQVTAVTPIIEKYSSKRQDLRQSMEDRTVDRDSIRSQMKQLKADEKQELSQALSEDQLSQWEQLQSQGRHSHSEGQTLSNEVKGTGHFGEGTSEGGGNE